MIGETLSNMVAAMAFGERENNNGMREYRTHEYGMAHEYRTYEHGAACEFRAHEYRMREYGAVCEYRTHEYTGMCEYAGACEYTGACEHNCEPYSQNTFKTGHFPLATDRAPSIWIIDSRTSHHIYNRPESQFQTYSRSSHPIDIRLGDDTIVQATHKGLVQVQNHWVKAVHLPTFRYSLLLGGDLDIHGYSITFEKGRWIISDSTNQWIIMWGEKMGMLYELDVGPSVLD